MPLRVAPDGLIAASQTAGVSTDLPILHRSTNAKVCPEAVIRQERRLRHARRERLDTVRPALTSRLRWLPRDPLGQGHAGRSVVSAGAGPRPSICGPLGRLPRAASGHSEFQHAIQIGRSFPFGLRKSEVWDRRRYPRCLDQLRCLGKKAPRERRERCHPPPVFCQVRKYRSKEVRSWSSLGSCAFSMTRT